MSGEHEKAVFAQQKGLKKAKTARKRYINRLGWQRSQVQVVSLRPNKHRNYDTKPYRKSGACFLFKSLGLQAFFLFLGIGISLGISFRCLPRLVFWGHITRYSLLLFTPTRNSKVKCRHCTAYLKSFRSQFIRPRKLFCYSSATTYSLISIRLRPGFERSKVTFPSGCLWITRW